MIEVFCDAKCVVTTRYAALGIIGWVGSRTSDNDLIISELITHQSLMSLMRTCISIGMWAYNVIGASWCYLESKLLTHLDLRGEWGSSLRTVTRLGMSSIWLGHYLLWRLVIAFQREDGLVWDAPTVHVVLFQEAAITFAAMKKVLIVWVICSDGVTWIRRLSKLVKVVTVLQKIVTIGCHIRMLD